MPFWLVKATWYEDEAEASERWAANAETVQDAVATVARRLRFQPHHIEAVRREPEDLDQRIANDLVPGEARRLP
ncbi:hypothetical protein AUC68_01595 [Methyloceanibacter methanicus]|uniref:Uncharacterized protein n=1 Tax=Methyloceanibacter methanicus TaxID=1774968 RepID=A0A1E3W237_9HYPH|nr:hypothetical protein [Methyloceanibacter methanicus]ODR99855.1 hypothetical protein AUC68_01595 [Methyloceanibacter methanicus]